MEIKIAQFPAVAERRRISTLRKFASLYENDAKTVLGLHNLIKKQFKKEEDLIYLAHAIPARLSDFYGDFVQGDVDRMLIKIKNGSDQENKLLEKILDDNDLKEAVYDWGVDQSEFGYFALLVRTDSENNVIIDTIPQDQYFPQADGSVIFATYKQDPAVREIKSLLLFTQNYEMDGGRVKITRKAWTTDGVGVITGTYDFAKMIEVLGEEYKPEEYLEIDELPIRQIDNGKRTKYGFGKSDYNDIMPQLAEINERATHVSISLLKNLDAKMAMPSSAYDADGNLAHQDTYEIDGKEEIIPQYIVNSNPLLSEAKEFITNEAKWISWLTGVPMFEILKSSMPETVESLRIQLFAAVRRTDTKRSKLRKGLADIIKIAFKLKNQELKNNVMIKFSEVLPVDELQLANTESIKITSGISSKRSAMKRIENFNDEEADAEMEEIEKENSIAGLGGPAPTI